MITIQYTHYTLYNVGNGYTVSLPFSFINGSFSSVLRYIRINQCQKTNKRCPFHKVYTCIQGKPCIMYLTCILYTLLNNVMSTEIFEYPKYLAGCTSKKTSKPQ